MRDEVDSGVWWGRQLAMYVAHYESYHRCIHFSSCDATRAFFCGARVRVARSLRQLEARKVH